MTQVIRAVYENGVLRPLEHLDLAEHEQVTVHVTTHSPTGPAQLLTDDPLAGIQAATGIHDLAERFDDYRFGR